MHVWEETSPRDPPDREIVVLVRVTIDFHRHPSVQKRRNQAPCTFKAEEKRIVRMSLTPSPYNQGYASYLAAMQLWDEPHQLSSLQLLKSLDDLDEEADEDDEEEDDDLEDLEDEDDEDDLDEDYDEDDDDEDEDEEDEDEDGGVKPLKMSV
jgi:hypothetical protein